MKIHSGPVLIGSTLAIATLLTGCAKQAPSPINLPSVGPTNSSSIAPPNAPSNSSLTSPTPTPPTPTPVTPPPGGPSISAQTVTRLEQAFAVSLPATGSNESLPQEQNGQLFVTTGNGSIFALDAVTGKQVWSYLVTHSLPYWMPKINRGVAVGKTSVYVLTPDDELVALNKLTGQVRYGVSVANPVNGNFESMAPLLANGTVIVGSSGGDEGIRGFVAAYDAHSGKRLWQFYTVPPRGQSWMAATGSHGGGSVWTTPAYDAASNSIYFGTGNPSPDYYGQTRPGPNPYTDSVVRLDLASGKLQWAEQEVAHDLWDYDVASPPLLFLRQGQLTVGEAGKDGYWYEWDAKTGQPSTAPVAFVREDHSPPTATGTKEWPGSNGGANYGPSAYDPLTGDAYIAGINGPEVLYSGPSQHTSFRLDLGTGQNPAPVGDWSGTITAVNVQTGQISWQLRTPTPPIGGVSVNAGGLVWFGLQGGTLEAVSAASGKFVWSTNTGAPIGSAPVLYQWQGHAYVVVMTGGAQSFANLYPYHGPNRLVGYRVN